MGSSASNSENSATHSAPVTPSKLHDSASNNGLPDEKPDLAHFHAENLEKYRKYEAEYTRRLMAKYFSKKNIYGESPFDGKKIIDGEFIMSSRWPWTRSFADPLKNYEELSNVGSTSETKLPSQLASAHQ